MQSELQFSLNLAKTKAWYGELFATFQQWAQRADIPWRAIRPHLDDVMNKARRQWPEAITDLPMNVQHQKQLEKHWVLLHIDFRI